MRLGLLVLLTGCAPDMVAPVPTEGLDPAARAVRVSMSLRGVRPSLEELDQVEADPAALERLVDEWMSDPRFGETIKDLHAEAFLLRTDVLDQLPAIGPLEGLTLAEIHQATVESPLRLVEAVVTQDRPYTEIVTTDEVWSDPVLSTIYGLPYDPAGPTWQISRWQDGRPEAGLLSDSEMWRRFESAGSNFHRLRANLVANAFLCADFAGRDIPVTGGIDLTDEAAVAQAVTTNPACVGCHQALDPLAAYFWGFKIQVKSFGVVKAYLSECAEVPLDTSPYTARQYCYPIEHYTPADSAGFSAVGLREPSFYGLPAHDLRALGQAIALDPRFAECSARRFESWLTQVPREDVPASVAAERRSTLEASGFSAKATLKAAVLADRFAGRGPDAVGPLATRPEQLARLLEDLTGFRWRAIGDPLDCAESSPLFGSVCWGEVDLLTTDRFGFRTLAGGIDGYYNTTPRHDPTPMRELVWSRVAFEAAAFGYDADRALPKARRRLFTVVEPDEARPEAVRAQLAAWVRRVLGRRELPEGGPTVAALFALWQARAAVDGPERAWVVTLAGLLQDPEVLFY